MSTQETSYLRDRRLSRALSATEVADRLGVHPHSILRWERRERLPAPEHIHGLARTLRVDTAEIARFFDGARTRDGRGNEALRDSVRGHGLRPLRSAARIPAPRIAAAVGVPPASVYNWEAGRVRIPSDLVPALAAAFDVEPDTLRDLLIGAHPSVPVRTVSELGRLRRRTGLSQSMVAERIGVSRHIVGAWERGRRPPLSAVRRLAGVYGVPVSAVARAARVDAPPLLDTRRWARGDLADVLRVLREWSGLTQRQVAERCGCSADAVRGWERGRGVPQPRMRDRLELLHGLPGAALLSAYP